MFAKIKLFLKSNNFSYGLLTGYSFPGIGMSSAMLGFGVYAGEAGLDIYLCMASLLVLWSMPGMVIFVSLYTAGAPILLMFTTILLANVRQFFLVLSGIKLMNINNSKIPLFKKVFWAHFISPTGWAELIRVSKELKPDDLYPFFKGLSLGLVSICILGTYIGFKLFDILPTHLIAIPVFIMPLYITILMLRTTDLFYRMAVISGGIIGPILYPYIGDWSIIVSGFLGGSIGLIADTIQRKSRLNA